MQVKTYLRRVRKLKLEIEAKKRQRESLYYTVIGSAIPIKKDNVQTSRKRDPQGDTIALMADLDDAIVESIKELCKMQAEAEELIGSLSKPECRAIFIDYYLNAYTWEQVADMQGYSIDNVFKLHKVGLEELSDSAQISLQ